MGKIKTTVGMWFELDRGLHTALREKTSGYPCTWSLIFSVLARFGARMDDQEFRRLLAEERVRELGIPIETIKEHL